MLKLSLNQRSEDSKLISRASKSINLSVFFCYLGKQGMCRAEIYFIKLVSKNNKLNGELFL